MMRHPLLILALVFGAAGCLAQTLPAGLTAAGATMPGGTGPSCNISPGTVTLNSGASQTFTASLTILTSVAYTKNCTGGSISTTAPVTGNFTAGNGAQSCTVTATGNDGITTCTASVTIRAVSISVSPASATVANSATLQISASVLNAQDTTVTWSCTGCSGSVNSSGLYTAPASGAPTDTVTATSNQDNTKTANSVITVSASGCTSNPSAGTYCGPSDLNVATRPATPSWGLRGATYSGDSYHKGQASANPVYVRITDRTIRQNKYDGNGANGQGGVWHTNGSGEQPQNCGTNWVAIGSGNAQSIFSALFSGGAWTISWITPTDSGYGYKWISTSGISFDQSDGTCHRLFGIGNTTPSTTPYLFVWDTSTNGSPSDCASKYNGTSQSISGASTVNVCKIRDAGADMGLSAGAAINDVSASSDGSKIATFLGGGQDAGTIVYLYNVTARTYTYWHTDTGVVGGTGGVSGTISTPDRFSNIHNIRLGADGRYIRVTGGGSNYFWDTTTVNAFKMTVSSSGHDVEAWTYNVNLCQNIASTLQGCIRQVDTQAHVDAPTVLETSGQLPSGTYTDSPNSHFAWSNAVNGSFRPILQYTATSNNPPERAWGDEGILVATDSSGKVIREFWLWDSKDTTGSSAFFTQAIGSISKDGSVACFTSDMKHGLGTYTDGSAAVDIFCVNLQ